MPVGFGEIRADHELFVAECIQDILQHVTFRMVTESMPGDREVCVF